MAEKKSSVEIIGAAQEALETSPPYPMLLERKSYIVGNYASQNGNYQFFYEEDGTYLFKRLITKPIL